MKKPLSDRPDRYEKLAYIVLAVNFIIVLLFLSGFVYVVYKVLTHFGIL